MTLCKVIVHPLSLLNISEQLFRKRQINNEIQGKKLSSRGILFGVVKNDVCSVVMSREMSIESKSELLTSLGLLKQVYGYLSIVGFFTVNAGNNCPYSATLNWVREVLEWLRSTGYISNLEQLVYLTIENNYSDLGAYNMGNMNSIPVIKLGSSKVESIALHDLEKAEQPVRITGSDNILLKKTQNDISFSLEEFALKLNSIITFLEKIEHGSVDLYGSEKKAYENLRQVAHFMGQIQRVKHYNQGKEHNKILSLVSIMLPFIFDGVKKIDALHSPNKDL